MAVTPWACYEEKELCDSLVEDLGSLFGQRASAWVVTVSNVEESVACLRLGCLLEGVRELCKGFLGELFHAYLHLPVCGIVKIDAEVLVLSPQDAVRVPYICSR